MDLLHHPPNCHNVHLLLVFLISVDHIPDPSFIKVFAAILEESSSTLKFTIIYLMMVSFIHKTQETAKHCYHLDEICNEAGVSPNKGRPFIPTSKGAPPIDALFLLLNILQCQVYLGRVKTIRVRNVKLFFYADSKPCHMSPDIRTFSESRLS